MDLAVQKRLSALLLKCGENRVRFDPERLEDISDAITRGDIRSLINSGAIFKLQKKGTSRFRAKKRTMQRIKGRRRGIGKRQGTKYSKITRKRQWINRIRVLRRALKKLKDEKVIPTNTYRKYYKWAKGGVFTSRANLELHMKMNNDLKKDFNLTEFVGVKRDRKKRRKELTVSILKEKKKEEKKIAEKKPIEKKVEEEELEDITDEIKKELEEEDKKEAKK